MSAIINGDSPSVTFSDGTTQATSAIVSGKVPYTNLPAGSILQVVNGTTSTGVTTSGTTYIDSGLTATITPKYSTSKILVLVEQNGISKNPGANGAGLKLQLLRNSTVLIKIQGYGGYTESTAYNWVGGVASSYLDSPATTSAITYKTQFGNENAVASVTINNDGSTSSITLLEIAG